VISPEGRRTDLGLSQRRLPWETTLQLSLTLALANPVLWYLLDRTKSGLTLSTAIGVLGTAVLITVNPSLIPAPTAAYSRSGRIVNTTETPKSASGGPDGFTLVAGVRSESIAVATWICSVLFCSCVCFGNIGRLLVPKR
jgi:hypothetical protein